MTVRIAHIRSILLVCLVGIFAACGTAQYRSEATGGSRPGSPAAYSKMKSERYAGKRALDSLADEMRSPKEEEADESPKPAKPVERMVVYFAKYSLQVESVRKSMADVQAIVGAAGGFIESAVMSDSYRAARIVIRVPVAEFEKTLAALERVGEVSAKEVSAADVTMEYRDISLRMEMARTVRDRLYQLLKAAKKADDRVKILREIERLTTQIDSMNARMAYLKNRATLSTIELRLAAKVREVTRSYLPSPFPWIAGLDPNKRTIFDSGGSVSYDAMSGFFHMKDEYYDRSGAYLFMTPDRSTGMRIGTVDNYPPANQEFWREALRLELSNRMYTIRKEDAIVAGAARFMSYEIALAKGVYVLSVAVTDENIVIVETVFPDDASYKKYAGQIVKFIQTIRVK